MKTKQLLSREDIVNTLNSHIGILSRYKVRKIGLFGSYVKNEQTSLSDIDFLVEFEEPTFDNYMDLVFFLEKSF